MVHAVSARTVAARKAMPASTTRAAVLGAVSVVVATAAMAAPRSRTHRQCQSDVQGMLAHGARAEAGAVHHGGGGDASATAPAAAAIGWAARAAAVYMHKHASTI